MLSCKGLIKNSGKSKALLNFILFSSFIIFLSCTEKKFKTEEQLWKYLNNPENQYKQEKTVNGVNYSLLYKPIDLLVQQEITDHQNNQKQIDSLRRHYQKYLYFTLTMSRNGQELLNSATGSRAEFGAMVNQLAFDMDQRVHLYTPKKDTLELQDFIYPRMYGMSGNTSILFVYPRDKKYLKEEYLNFTVEDLGFYTGEVRFKVPVKIIKNEPRLRR